jgi:membrane-associated phospholipid phosphatase
MNRSHSVILILLSSLFLMSENSFSQNHADLSIFRSINNSHSQFSDHFFLFQSATVKPVYVGLPLGFLATGIIQKNKKAEEAGTLLAATAVFNFGITTGMKYLVDRKRPFKALRDVHTKGALETSPSFPSGHTSAAFAMATMLSLSYPKWYVIIPSYTWASLAGYSRMAIGMHYPSDVLVGAIVGAGSAFLIYELKKPIMKLKSKIF